LCQLLNLRPILREAVCTTFLSTIKTSFSRRFSKNQLKLHHNLINSSLIVTNTFYHVCQIVSFRTTLLTKVLSIKLLRYTTKIMKMVAHVPLPPLILRASEPSIRLSCARIGSSQVNAPSRRVALSHMALRNLTLSLIFPRTIRRSFAKDSMKTSTVPTVLDANLSIPKFNNSSLWHHSQHKVN